MNSTGTKIIMNHTRSAAEAPFLGFFQLSTHRFMQSTSSFPSSSSTDDHPSSLISSSLWTENEGEAAGDFPYETFIAAVAVGFFRSTVYRANEPAFIRYFFSVLLATLAYTRKSYELITAVEMFSYFLSWIVQHLLNQMQKRRWGISNSSVGDSTRSTESSKRDNCTTAGVSQIPTRTSLALEGTILIAGSAGVSLILANAITSWKLIRLLATLTPDFIERVVFYLFPVQEIYDAYDIVKEFVPSVHELDRMFHHLFFVTFHIQCGMGYLGIEFLRQEQSRKNQLIRMDIEHFTQDDLDEKDVVDKNNSISPTSTTTPTESKLNGIAKSDVNMNTANDNSQSPTTASKLTIMQNRASKFQRAAGPFILWVAIPYMIQIIAFGNMNSFAFSCVSDEMHRIVRIRQVFAHNNNLLAMSAGTPTSSSGYAYSMNTIITTVYDLFNRKLFSLPKIFLLPTVMARQPMLMVKVFPFIFISDYIKATFVSFMTKRIETLQKDIKELSGIRTKVESFDIKNAELMQRSATNMDKVRKFTKSRWEILTTQIQSRTVVNDLITRSKEFFAFLQRNFVFAILIDCALAQLIAIQKITTAEVFVFSRAIEDAVDLVLMRSRSEAELARMKTEATKLREILNIWENSQQRRTESKEGSDISVSPTGNNLLHCRIQSRIPTATPTLSVDSHHQHNKALVIRHLHYTRGTASARIDHLELHPGVYALTGANGSGKSTLFRIIMSCNTNEKVTDLPPSINLLTPAEPLMEEEDILREQACLEDDEEDEKIQKGDAVDSMSCDADANKVSKPPIVLADGTHSHPIPKLSIVMPSSEIVEISQTFYWPLYAKPIDWIFEEHISASYNHKRLLQVARKVAEELDSLDFFLNTQPVATTTVPNDKETNDSLSSEDTIQRIVSELLEEKEDWFSNLSGGQKSKVELVRTVFMRERCPDVLLIDETMAPLDPASKELVMAKLKLFCNDSIVIVIYHTDVGLAKEIDGGKTVDCIPSNNFFDKNIHLEKGMVHTRDTC